MRFRRNPLFEAQAKADPRYRAGMALKAKLAAEAVRQMAPKGGTGHYAKSITTDKNVIYSTDVAAHIIEFGGGHIEVPYAPMRRGVRAAGLRLRELPKP